MKLYYKAGACSLASHIMLNEVGETFEIEAVETAKGQTESGRNYKEINVNGYVPTLEVEDGVYLSEGVAILQYIADTHADQAYSPPLGSVERARLQQFLNYAAAELHKAWGPLFSDSSTDAEKAAAETKVRSKFDYLEKVLSDARSYLVAETFSVADAYTFVLIYWANFKAIDLSAWPNIAAYVDRIADRESVNAAFTAEGLA